MEESQRYLELGQVALEAGNIPEAKVISTRKYLVTVVKAHQQHFFILFSGHMKERLRYCHLLPLTSI